MSDNSSSGGVDWGKIATTAAPTAAAGIFGIGSARKAYHRSKKLMDKQFAMDKEMWDYQNAYNTPAAQMARLKAAGLNPALMYGQGTTGNASGAPQSKFTELTPFMGAAQIAQSTAAGIQMSLAGAQKENIEAETAFKSIKGAVEAGNYGIAKEMSKYQMANMSKDLEVKDSQIGLNEIRVSMEKENIKLSGFKQLEVQSTIKKIESEVTLNTEVIKEYEKGFSKNPIKTITQMFDVPNLTEKENRQKAIISAASLATGRSLITAAGKKIAQTGFFRTVLQFLKRKK